MVLRAKKRTIRQGLAAMNQGMGSDGASPSPVAACLGRAMIMKTELFCAESCAICEADIGPSCGPEHKEIQ
jgi:hypothetical protein